jgi:hypothetical protein
MTLLNKAYEIFRDESAKPQDSDWVFAVGSDVLGDPLAAARTKVPRLGLVWAASNSRASRTRTAKRFV